ncbi:MAG TPA: hypothetical protein VFM65_09935 [Flavobacteriaceae bacterium]|nr:hypothetical protein [Flavobacteriaceae bacterium]
MPKETNTISLATAQIWAKKWRKEEGTYNAHHEVHAFLIPKEDLTELLAEDVDAVRAYVGVDENNVEKLMIVGTKFNSETGEYEDMVPGGNPEGKIYDFTTPCPPICDPASPLNDIGEN